MDARVLALLDGSAGMTLATRNVADFRGIDQLVVVGPWHI
jgi:hypothetical protein